MKMMMRSREIQNGHIQNVLYAHKHIGDVFQSNGTERLCVGGAEEMKKTKMLLYKKEREIVHLDATPSSFLLQMHFIVEKIIIMRFPFCFIWRLL